MRVGDVREYESTNEGLSTRGSRRRWLIDKGGAKEYSSASGTKSSHTNSNINNNKSTQQRPFPSRMKQELVQPHAYVALRLPSDSTIVVQVLQNTYVK